MSISISRSTFPHFGTFYSSSDQARLASIKTYYKQVDQNNFNDVLERFADSAVYERQGWASLIGKNAITRFFKRDRTLRGKHSLTAIYANQYPSQFVKWLSGKTVYAEGLFDGTQGQKPVHLKFQDFWVFRPKDNRVIFRKSWIQFPKGPTLKV